MATALRQPRPWRLWVATVIALALIAVLVGLGYWQVQRLAWKRHLIAVTAERVQLEPVPAPDQTQWPAVDLDRYGYRPVCVRGHWLYGYDTWVQATTELGAGYWLLRPLARDDGTTVLINRGFVAHRSADLSPASSTALRAASSSAVTVIGLLRISEAGGIFPRRNDAHSDRWFSREIPAIVMRRGLGQDLADEIPTPAGVRAARPVAPYFIDAQRTVDGQGSAAQNVDQPVAGLTVVKFRNPHLAYALTWFTLALMTAAALWRLWRSRR